MKARIGGLVAVLLAATGLTAVAAVAGSDPLEPPPRRSLPVTAQAAPLVCPGPETLQVPEGGDPVTSPGHVTVRALLAPGAEGSPDTDGSLGPLGDGPAVRLATAGPVAGVGDVTLDEAGAQVVLGRTPPQSAAPLTAGVQWTLGRTGDLRSLAARPCTAAATSSWLVGGTTRQGSRARLLLANPMAAPAVVDVRILGPQGAVDAPSGQGVLVPAGSQVALFVDALAPSRDTVAVHMQARSGRVVATLHESVMRALVAGGADDVVAAATPSTRQVVPGLDVRAVPRPDGEPALPQDPTAPGAVAVRVAVPGGEEAVVRVRLVGADGPVELTAGITGVPGGSVVDIPVTGVEEGVYAAVVESDVPVVAGAVVGRAVVGSELAGTPEGVAADVPPAERAWAASTEPLTTRAVALPAGVPARLALTAAGEAAKVRLTPLNAEGTPGEETLVDVAAGTTTGVGLPASAAGLLVVPEGGQVHAAVLLEVPDDNGALVSVLPVSAGPPAAPPTRPVVERPRVGL